MKHRRGGIASRFMHGMRRYKTDPLLIAKRKAVEVIQWGHDCKRYEFKDGTRVIHNELLNCWDI